MLFTATSQPPARIPTGFPVVQSRKAKIALRSLPILQSLLLSACIATPRPLNNPTATAPTGADQATFATHTGPGYIAHIHLPVASTATSRAPAVILIGGSGGGIGWQDYMAARLAQRGFVAMAVAYFALDSLPRELDRIPLEAFDNAIDWLSAQPFVDNRHLGMGGVSKGAEAALLVSSHRTDLKAIALFSPTAYVFQSVTRDFRKTSSWTRAGQELAFISYGAAKQGSPLVEFYRLGVSTADIATRKAAAIPVEKIKAPVLLLSGRNDTLWGSGDWADSIDVRVRRAGKKNFQNVVYPDAGHLISSIRDDDVTFRGGTKAGNDFAQRDGQRRFLEFFDRELR